MVDAFSGRGHPGEWPGLRSAAQWKESRFHGPDVAATVPAPVGYAARLFRCNHRSRVVQLLSFRPPTPDRRAYSAGHRLLQIPVDDVSAAAVQNAAQVSMKHFGSECGPGWHLLRKSSATGHATACIISTSRIQPAPLDRTLKLKCGACGANLVIVTGRGQEGQRSRLTTLFRSLSR